MNKNKDKKENANLYPGVAANFADDCKHSDKLVKEGVKDLNNNPRNGDQEKP